MLIRLHITSCLVIIVLTGPALARAQPSTPTVDYGNDARAERLGQQCLERLARARGESPATALTLLSAAQRACDAVSRFSPAAGQALSAYRQELLRAVVRQADRTTGAQVGAFRETPPPAPEHDFSSNRRAERFARSCLERLERAASREPRGALQQIEAARRDCEGAARHDPAGQSLVGHQQAMVRWAEVRVEAERTSRADAFALDTQVSSLRLELNINTNWSSSSDAGRVDLAASRLLEHAQDLASAIHNAGASREVDGLRDAIMAVVATTREELERMEQELGGASVVGGIYNGALTLDTQLRVGRLVFPENERIRESALASATWMRRVGGRAGAATIRDRAIAARAASARFPAATSRDAGVENEARAAFLSQGWDESVLAIALTEADWTIERVAGRIVSRYRSVAIGVRLANGSCRYYDFTIGQAYNAPNWGRAGRRSHSTFAIACDNLPR